MSKKLYLTIDDAPSIHLRKKIDFLLDKGIFALFYVRGEFIKARKDQLVYAIQNGFGIGNHSYTHPYFSKISMEKMIEEVVETERLIEECYVLANRERKIKCIRLPFGDRGGEKSLDVQTLLHRLGFVKVDFGKKDDGGIDSLWDIDTKDYKKKFINDRTLFREHLESIYSSSKDGDVWMAHDFDHTQHLFEEMMDFLLLKNVEFLPISF
ncbi:polysaccharide deacetylase family protein [bacterium]|nr:polysaccharide deacetylase family protein [bacterium]